MASRGGQQRRPVGIPSLGPKKAIDGIGVERLGQALGWHDRPPVTWPWVAATMAP
jgi:hypothetical protein